MSKEELEILFSADEYLYKLIPGISKLTEEARSRDFSNIKALVDGLEGIIWLKNAFENIDGCNKMNIDSSLINETLTAVTNAVQSKDYTQLADLLEYEIGPLINSWHEELSDILRSGDSVN